MNKQLATIFAYLKELFPSPETELHYSTPFQFVVAVMLSAQATDVQVNKVTKKLFEKILTSEDLLTFGFAHFERAISSINYYKTKAKHIWETAKILMKNEKGKLEDKRKINKQTPPSRCIGTPPLNKGGISEYIDGIPNTLEELMKLPGVGVKTGKLIAHVVYDKPFIAVDTHIHRVSNRLGLKSLRPSDTSLSKRETKNLQTKTPEETSELLENIIPDDYKDFAHHALVLFGRYYCTAKHPTCESCKLKKLCLYYKKHLGLKS